VPAIFEGVVYFGSNDGNVYAYSESGKKLRWHRRTGASVQAVAVVPNGVLAASLDNFAYLLSLNKGSLIWRRQLPGRISARPITSSDGALFTPFSTDQAIVLNLRDGKTANTLPLGEENSSSAAPVSVNNLVLITIPHGLLAFSSATPKWEHRQCQYRGSVRDPDREPLRVNQQVRARAAAETDGSTMIQVGCAIRI
jgi:outer membrane protein assembly factor BamB